MENQIELIQESIASLRENAAKYREIIKARCATEPPQLAEKLMEIVTQIEAKAAELEAGLEAFRN